MSIQSEAVSAHVLVVGGSSGMGLSLAERLLQSGTFVTIAGRSEDRLRAARDSLPCSHNLQTVKADVTREEEVIQLLAGIGPLDHIVSTAADIGGAYVLLPDMDVSIAKKVLDSKIIAPLLLAKHGAARLRAGGSLTFVSGIAAYRPAAKGTVVAAVNGALASLTYALAVELAPIRVNAVSPGWVDTPIWEAVAGNHKAATLAAMAKRLPAGRIGHPSDIAAAIESAMQNGFMTGSVLHVDGGQRLV